MAGLQRETPRSFDLGHPYVFQAKVTSFGEAKPPRRTATAITSEVTEEINKEHRALIQIVGPSVFSIYTYKNVIARDGKIGRKEVGVGSGFVIAPGVIATDAHVVQEAQTDKYEGLYLASSEIAPDGSQRDQQRFNTVKVLYMSPNEDIAFVGYDPNEHPEVESPTLTLGSVQDIEAGDELMAYGTPWNLPGTVSFGHVANKRINVLEDNGQQTRTIGVSVEVRPGMSGGPIVDRTGKVVAVTEARFGDDPTTGFATIIDDVKAAWEEYQAQGQAAA